MSYYIKIDGNLDIIKKILKEFPQYKKKILYYIAKEFAKRGRANFPIVITGITRDAIFPQRKKNYYTVGIRNWYLKKMGRISGEAGKIEKSYLGRLQKKWKFLQVLRKSVSDAQIEAIGQGFLDKVIK